MNFFKKLFKSNGDSQKDQEIARLEDELKKRQLEVEALTLRVEIAEKKTEPEPPVKEVPAALPQQTRTVFGTRVQSEERFLGAGQKTILAKEELVPPSPEPEKPPVLEADPKPCPVFSYTAEQEQIFDFIKKGEGHGIVDAVAGSGKTTTIMEATRHVEPGKTTLFCAFNKSIATEIGRRIAEMGIEGVTVKTIHALGHQMLRQSFDSPPVLQEHKFRTLIRQPAMQAQLQEGYETVFKQSVQHKLIKNWDPGKSQAAKQQIRKNQSYKTEGTLLRLLDQSRLDLPQNEEEFLEMVERHAILTPPQLKAGLLKPFTDMHERLIKAGTRHSEATSQFDFTDMIYLPVALGLKPVHTFDFLFIDECQDLSKAQLATVLKYAHDDSRVMAVGDPHQAIYGFAGADAHSFERVKAAFDAAPFPLSTCFRCPQKVIQLAQGIRPDIQGKTDNDLGEVIFLGPKELFNNLAAGDLVISRKRDKLMSLTFALMDAGKLISLHPDDGAAILAELRSWFKAQERSLVFSPSPSQVQSYWDVIRKRNHYRIRMEIEEIPYVDDAARKALLKEKLALFDQRLVSLQGLAKRWPHLNTVRDLLEELHQDLVNDSPEAIKLSSIHRAKGLENDRVFILDYDQLPMKSDFMKDWQLIQEQNLKYVALTRPKKVLYLVSSPDR